MYDFRYALIRLHNKLCTRFDRIVFGHGVFKQRNKLFRDFYCFFTETDFPRRQRSYSNPHVQKKDHLNRIGIMKNTHCLALHHWHCLSNKARITARQHASDAAVFEYVKQIKSKLPHGEKQEKGIHIREIVGNYRSGVCNMGSFSSEVQIFIFRPSFDSVFYFFQVKIECTELIVSGFKPCQTFVKFDVVRFLGVRVDFIGQINIFPVRIYGRFFIARSHEPFRQ